MKRKSRAKALKAYEGPNVIEFKRPSPPKRARDVFMKIGKCFDVTGDFVGSLAEPNAQSSHPSHNSLSLPGARKLSPEETLMFTGIWKVIPQVRQPDAQAFLLNQAVDSGDLPDHWHQVAVNRLRELENGEADGQA